jgi:L-ascorbate oxidase
MRSFAGLLSSVAAFALTALSAGGASAQLAERDFADPPTLGVQKGVVPRVTLQAAPAAQSMTTKKSLDLDVVYTPSHLRNPATGRDDAVYLRSYSGAGIDPTARFVAPTLEINPGDTIDITLHNKLPADPSCTGMDMNPDKPHCFNGTNLHSHGLWVSPTGNSDNVLLSINPGVSFQYEYNVPPDHPAGTFWYHTHRHGSTALQVASGMAGALIIHGDRLPTRTAHGDVDTLLKPFADHILVLQQIAYACLDKDGNIKVKTEKVKQPDGTEKEVVVAWVCDPGDTGVVEFYADKNGRGLGPQDWAQSGRFTSVNGLVLPTFKATQGGIQRWRLIHAGIRDTISLQFYKKRPNALALGPATADATAKFISDNCIGDPLPYQVIASDGLTMAAARQQTVDVLQPGYRSDALVVFPEAGSYCVVNAQVSASSSVTRSAVTPRLIGYVDVAPGTAVDKNKIRDYVVGKLVDVAKDVIKDTNVRDEVVADLQNGFRLTHFTPHPDITDAEVKGHQYLTFFIDTSSPDTKFQVSSTPFDQFDPKSYDPNRVDRVLMLGSADEWQMQSRFVSHPYHIHVNPFQIVKIIDPNGKDVSEPDAVDNADPTSAPDPQYPGLKGVWKDTLWVKSLIPTVAYPKGIYTIVIRTRYERYIGEFVLHCHILDHEDQGMMQNVRIDLPDGQGGTTGMH